MTPDNQDDADISLSSQAIALAVTDNDSLAAALEESGMQMRDFIVLSFVSDQGSITTSHLARLVGLDVQTTVGCIGRLTDAGLVYGDLSVAEEDRLILTTETGGIVAAKILRAM